MTETMIEILYAQFSMFVSSGMSIHDSNQLKIDEFDLIVDMYNTHLEDTEFQNG